MRRFLAILSFCWGIVCGAQDILEFHPAETVVPGLLSARKPMVMEDGSAVPSSWTVLAFSDLHGCADNLSRIVRFKEAYSAWIDEALHLGDVFEDHILEPHPWGQVAGAEDFLLTVGNHDCQRPGESWVGQEETFDALLGPYINGWNVVRPEGAQVRGNAHYKACYYYKDDPDSGVRLVVLDAMHYDAAQDRWLRAVLTDAVRLERTVIAASHFPAQSGLVRFDSGFSDLDEEIGPVSPRPGQVIKRLPDAACAAVDAFLDAGGVFVCWLGGHMHRDHLGTVPGHARQWQVILDKSGSADRYMQEDRTPGTRNQDAFNLVTVNPSRGLLIMERIGCVQDQYLRGKHRFVYGYKTGKVYVNE